MENRSFKHIVFICLLVLVMVCAIMAGSGRYSWAMAQTSGGGTGSSCSSGGCSSCNGGSACCKNSCCTCIPSVMQNHQNWVMGCSSDSFFHKQALPAMMVMTETLQVTGMYQMLITGHFFDAKNQAETQLLLQRLASRAHKDYRPSVGMCTFGTNVRALAGAERNGVLTAFALGQRSQDRQLGNRLVSGAEGASDDRAARLEIFKKYYCDTAGMNGGLKTFCETSAPAETQNKDIDFARTVGMPATLDIDFAEPELTPEERDVFALSNNLYGHDLFKRPGKGELTVKANQEKYLDMRALLAKRSVAESSFNAIVGMKARGPEDSEGTGEYMTAILTQLGIPSDQVPSILGGDAYPDGPARPSYYAQMEVLGQKIYQNPSFYMNLYDTPINVIRKDVAMQAIDLMTDRSLYKSELRTEALLSVLLETEIMTYQEAVQNRMAGVTNKGK